MCVCGFCVRLAWCVSCVMCVMGLGFMIYFLLYKCCVVMCLKVSACRRSAGPSNPGATHDENMKMPTTKASHMRHVGEFGVVVVPLSVFLLLLLVLCFCFSRWILYVSSRYREEKKRKACVMWNALHCVFMPFYCFLKDAHITICWVWCASFCCVMLADWYLSYKIRNVRWCLYVFKVCHKIKTTNWNDDVISLWGWCRRRIKRVSLRFMEERSDSSVIYGEIVWCWPLYTGWWWCIHSIVWMGYVCVCVQPCEYLECVTHFAPTVEEKRTRNAHKSRGETNRKFKVISWLLLGYKVSNDMRRLCAGGGVGEEKGKEGSGFRCHKPTSFSTYLSL